MQGHRKQLPGIFFQSKQEPKAPQRSPPPLMEHLILLSIQASILYYSINSSCVKYILLHDCAWKGLNVAAAAKKARLHQSLHTYMCGKCVHLITCRIHSGDRVINAKQSLHLIENPMVVSRYCPSLKYWPPAGDRSTLPEVNIIRLFLWEHVS